MIDKVFFDKEMTLCGKPAFGLLFYNPYPDDDTIKVQALNKDYLSTETILSIPVNVMDDFWKACRNVAFDIEKIDSANTENLLDL